MANLFQPSIPRLIDAAVSVVSGGKMYFYLTNTLTPAPVWLDQAGTVASPNPVLTDSTGNFPAVFLDPSTTYRIRFTNSAGVPLRPDIDPVAGSDPAILTVVATATAAATTAGAVQVALATQQATYAGYAAATAGAYPNSAATNVPRGLTQASVGALTAGTGGTPGTYTDGTWTGGNFAINPTFTYTIDGSGHLTAFTVTGPGLYIGSSPSVPTPVFGHSLSGAAAALTAQFLAANGVGYWVQSADNAQLIRYTNVNGTATLVTGVGPVTIVLSDAPLGIVLPYVPTPTDLFADFAHNKYYNKGVATLTSSDWLAGVSGTFSRPSAATYTNSSGLTAVAPSNTLRFTYDPSTLVPLGILIEPTSANLWPYSNIGNGAGSSAWTFSPTGITLTDNNATGSDGGMTAFTIRETAVNSNHAAFYYPGAVDVIPGHFYAVQFRFKPIGGRTKYQIQSNTANGMPSSVIDLSTLSASNGYVVKARADGFYDVSAKFTGAGAGTDVVFFIFYICDSAGTQSYLGDVTKGCDIDNVMFSEIASLAAPLPSMIYRPDGTAATRSADALGFTIPAGISRMSYVFSDNSQQISTVSPGTYSIPTTMSGSMIKELISVDLSTANIAITNWAGKAGPSVSPVQNDISGLTTTSSPTFVGTNLSGGLATIGASTLKMDTTLFQWTSSGPSLTSADRGVIIGANTFKSTLHASYTNSVGIGQDACANTITIATATVVGDTAGGSASIVQSSCLYGNEAGNTSGTIQACNITGNTSGKAGNYLRSEIYGQASATFNSLTDTVAIGNQTLIGSSGNTCTVTNSVVVGSGAGSSVLDASHGTVTNLILVGKGIQPPTATTSNYYSFGNAFTYLGSTSTITLQTPVAGKAKVVYKGLAASTSYANDAAAAAGGVGIDELYRNGSVIQVRVT